MLKTGIQQTIIFIISKSAEFLDERFDLWMNICMYDSFFIQLTSDFILITNPSLNIYSSHVQY